MTLKRYFLFRALAVIVFVLSNGCDRAACKPGDFDPLGFCINRPMSIAEWEAVQNSISQCSPQSVGAWKLSEASSAFLSPSIADARPIVVNELLRDNENSEEFYVTTSIEPGRIIFHLWHESAFFPVNCGTLGNPGGRCRDFVYDEFSKRISEKRKWQ